MSLGLWLPAGSALIVGCLVGWVGLVAGTWWALGLKPGFSLEISGGSLALSAPYWCRPGWHKTGWGVSLRQVAQQSCYQGLGRTLGVSRFGLCDWKCVWKDERLIILCLCMSHPVLCASLMTYQSLGISIYLQQTSVSKFTHPLLLFFY